MTLFLTAALFTAFAAAQTFEVATIKPAAPDRFRANLDPAAEAMIRFQGGPGTSTPTRLTYSGVTLQMMLARAYGVTREQVSGPDWIDADRFDVAAVVPEDANAAQLQTMLQNLLTERFRLSLHRESKEASGYALTVGKDGHKLQPAQTVPQSEDPREIMAAVQARLAATPGAAGSGPRSSIGFLKTTMARLAAVLTENLRRPVQDKTGLTGEYSFRLQWVPDGATMPDGSLVLGPSLIQAVEEQLGLKLESHREPMDTLVVDSETRVPVEN